MPRLGTVKKRGTAKKAKKATTSAKSTKSAGSTSTQSPSDDPAVDPDTTVKAEPEPEPEPENPIQVDLHDKLVVLDLVRGWEIGQALRSKTKETPYRTRYNYYGEAYSFKNAQEMLDDAKPMDLKDATMLWTSLLHNSSLNWNGRRGVKKDYKRWTFKHWAGRNRGPTSLTVDARGSEHKQRIVSVQRRLQTLEVSAANQWYIRSYGRIAECYFIHNPEPNNVELSNEWYTYNNDFSDEKRRLRQVYGPRVIDMSNENGKALLDFVFGDVAVSRYVPSEIGLPRHWSIYCSSLVEQPAFEVVLQEKKISKYTLEKQARDKAYKEELEVYYAKCREEAAARLATANGQIETNPDVPGAEKNEAGSSTNHTDVEPVVGSEADKPTLLSAHAQDGDETSDAYFTPDEDEDEDDDEKKDIGKKRKRHRETPDDSELTGDDDA